MWPPSLIEATCYEATMLENKLCMIVLDIPLTKGHPSYDLIREPYINYMYVKITNMFYIPSWLHLLCLRRHSLG